MILFIDTNVLLDVLAKREPFYQASAEVWSLCEGGAHQGAISVISFNNIFYIARKLGNRRTAHRMLGILRDIFQPISFDAQLLNQALAAGFADFEDSVQYHSAIRAGADFLLTRNVGHFPKASFPIVTPKEFLASQSSSN